MASNWKGHRGVSDKSKSHLSSTITAPTSASNSMSDNTDRNEVPQRPPTVGQELPNNLVPSLQDWHLEPRLKSSRNRKKGNLEKSREKKSDGLGMAGNSSSEIHVISPVTVPPHLQMCTQHKQHLVGSDCESLSDGDANARHSIAHDARPKRGDRNLAAQSGDFRVEKDSVSAKVMHNAAKRLNTNHVAGKLVQIRDYIKQVTSTMETLENVGDPRVLEKVERLHKVRLDLVENEHNLVELLQRVSSEQTNEEHSNSDAESIGSIHESPLENVDGTSGISDASGQEDGNEGVDSYHDSHKKRNELLRKVAESQEKLKALQDQQALLIALQQQAENRLAEARTFHDHLINKPNGNEAAKLSPEEISASRTLQRDLLNIEQRLALLQDLQANRGMMEPLSRSVDGEARGPEKDEKVDLEQQQQLRDKLQDLQIKKRQMDDLMSELCYLRETRLRENQPLVSDAGAGPSDKKRMVASKVSLPAAQQSLKSSEILDRRRKIDEMQSWLCSMENIVSNLQSEHGNSVKTESKPQVSHSNCMDSNAMESTFTPLENNQNRLKRSRKTKTDNLSREQSNDRIGKIPSNHALLSNTDRSHHQQHRDSSVEETFAEETDVQFEEKTRQLHAAKSKLQKLQDLLSAVQSGQLNGQRVNVEHIEQLLNSIENEDYSSQSTPQAVSSNRRTSMHQAESHLLHNVKTNTKPPVLSHPGQHQQSDREWIEQRNTVRTDQSRRKSNSTQGSIGSTSKLLASNQDLWMEMRNEMALHEELHHRRQELERLMRKDAGKNYLVNQDNQSEIMSASAKSEPLIASASIGATDATSAATWGGSSVDNGARDTVDGNESQECNERIDNEEYSSEEALEGEEPADSIDTAQESGQSKTRNCTSSGNVGEADSMWRGQEAQLPLVGLSADITHNFPSNHMTGQVSKAAWQQSDRVNTSEGTDLPACGDPINTENPSLPFSLNMPWQPNAAQLQHQMETATLLCQTILRDQNLLSGLGQQLSAQVPVASVNVPDASQLHHTQLIQQQLLLGLSHCYHLLYLQNVEMQRLRQTLQGAVPVGLTFPGSHQYSRPQVRSHANVSESPDCQSHSVASQWHLDNPSLARLSMSSSSSHPLHPSQVQSQQSVPHETSHGPITETLNNQVPPGNRANNYWDNFRSYSRQNLLSSNSHPNKSNDCPNGRCHTLPRTSAPVPTLNVKSPQHGSQMHLSQPQEEFLRTESFGNASDVTGHTRREEKHARSSHNTSTKEEIALQNSSKDKVNKDLSRLSTANVLKYQGNLGTKTSAPANQSGACVAIPPGTLSKLHPGSNKANAEIKERSLQGHTKDTVANLSQIMDDSVHEEVSKLVTQFDADPEVLIRLLRELRKLNSERAARNALRALHNASQSSSEQCEAENTGILFRPTPTQQRSSRIGDPPGGRPWLHESTSSSDEEQWSCPAKNKKSERPFAQFSNSWSFYDAANPTVSHGRQLPDSNPHSSSTRVNGDLYSLSTTNNQPGKLSIKKKYKQVPSYLLSPSTARQGNSPPECVGSSAQELDTEPFAFDVPCARFNVKHLEQQLQHVMMSVSSFIATFSQHTCNSQIISGISSHIVSVVLSLIPNASHEMWNFIPAQLSSVLDNVIQKYIGKRIRDCEQSLMSELAEVLFNELAFLQLMKNMDGHSVQARSQKYHALVQDLSMGISKEESKTAINLPTNLVANSAAVCIGGQAEATDADLGVMIRRGDDEDNKDQEDFSCHNSDINAGNENVGWAASAVVGDEASSFRVSPMHSAANMDSHPLSPLPLPELGAVATAAEGQGEVRYFDREVEMEGEGMGDTQDLAEADQSQGFMESLSAMDDVQAGENFQVWGVDHNLINGGIDRTEDDQHDEDDPLGAAGGAAAFSLFAQLDSEKSGPELGLDEVPIKLRDGSGSRNSNRDRGKEDSNSQVTPEHSEDKSRRTGGSDHGAKS